MLTQVRGEFLRASTSDPEGPARAAKALSRGFELLNCCAFCYLCRSCDDSDTGEHCEDCVGKKEDQLLGASSPSVGERLLLFSFTPVCILSCRQVPPHLCWIRDLAATQLGAPGAMRLSVNNLSGLE